MNRLQCPLLVSTAWLVFEVIVSTTRADIMTSFSQVNTTGSGNVTYNPSSPPPNGTYTFNVAASHPSETLLKAKAGVDVSVNHDTTTEVWMSSEANASASTSITDSAIVQGVAGGSSGMLAFTWVVTGFSDLSLHPSGNSVVVNDLSTTTLLTSDMLSMNEVLLEEIHSYDGPASTNDDFGEIFDASSSPFVFEVPWSAGTGLPVEFELSTAVALDLVGSEVSEFTAGLLADFFSTATLVAADVCTASCNGSNSVAGAYLESSISGFDYPVSVPEPSAFPCLMFAAMVLAVRWGIPACSFARARS